MNYTDWFEPRNDPARSIYIAFQLEAKKRNGRSIEEWQVAEREAVLHEAKAQATRLGLRVPTMDDIVLAEIKAMGHIDYGTQWAHNVSDLMYPPCRTHNQGLVHVIEN